MPGEELPFPALHFHSVCPRDLRLARKAGGKISSQEAILTESPFAALFEIFLVDEGDVTLAASETPLMPVLFTIKNKVFHMDGQLARLATVRCCLHSLLFLNLLPDAGVALKTFFSENELSLPS